MNAAVLSLAVVLAPQLLLSDGAMLVRLRERMRAGDGPWSYPQISEAPWATFAKLLQMAAQRYGDPRYAEAHRRLPPAARESLDNLVFPAVLQ